MAWTATSAAACSYGRRVVRDQRQVSTCSAPALLQVTQKKHERKSPGKRGDGWKAPEPAHTGREANTEMLRMTVESASRAGGFASAAAQAASPSCRSRGVSQGAGEEAGGGINGLELVELGILGLEKTK